jgi:hypothetical protein
MLAIPSFAQEKSAVSTEKNVLKINTLSLVFMTGSVFYERKISDAMSAQLGFGYTSLKYKTTKFTGLILTPEVRIYPKKNAIDGFYVAPYFRYMNLSLTVDNAKGTLSAIGGGLLIGHQWITDSGFTMDLFFGGHYGTSNVKATVGDATVFDTKLFSGSGVRAGFALGFAF